MAVDQLGLGKEFGLVYMVPWRPIYQPVRVYIELARFHGCQSLRLGAGFGSELSL